MNRSALLPLLPLLLLAQASPLRAAPTLRLDAGKSHFFGKAGKGSPIEHSFPVSNPGDAPLKLDVGVHCKCLSIVPEPEVIPPGGSGRIRVSMDPSGEWGSVAKVAEILTNDPSKPRFDLTFTGVVEGDLLASPDQVFLGKYDQKDVVGPETTIALYSRSRPFRIEKVEAAPELEVRSEALSKTKGHLLWVRFKRRPPVGAYQRPIVVFTDHPESPSKIPFGAMITGRVALEPPVLVFKPGETATKIVKISWKGPKALTVKSAEPRFQGLDVKLKRGEGPFYLLEARFDSERMGKVRAGSVLLTTDDEDNASLTIPVHIIGMLPEKG